MSTGFISIYESDIRTTSTVKGHDLGTLGQTPDGRKFRYARAGGVDLDPGKLVVAATQVGDNVNLAVAAAAAVGDKSVTVTLGNTAVTADQYADGYLVMNDAAGEAIAYRIKSHPAALATTALVVSLVEPIKVALTTASEASLVLNPYADVVISVTDQADMPVGVPNVTVDDADYFWCQTGGVVAVLADEAVTAGLALTTGTGVAGAVEALDAAGEFQIGVALQALVDTEYRAAYLTID